MKSLSGNKAVSYDFFAPLHPSANMGNSGSVFIISRTHFLSIRCVVSCYVWRFLRIGLVCSNQLLVLFSALLELPQLISEGEGVWAINPSQESISMVWVFNVGSFIFLKGWSVGGFGSLEARARGVCLFGSLFEI